MAGSPKCAFPCLFLRQIINQVILVSKVEISRIAVKVQGRVQGVWYRASAMETARELNLVGWVKNEADGSVTAEAQGPVAQLIQFVNWCKQGPPAARVDQIEVHDRPLITTETTFTIRK